MAAAPPPTETQHALPLGLRLDEFEIRAVLGVGGFGIVYHAFDHALERDVAIKEYMPASLAARSATLQVSVLSQGHAETFALGLKSFVNEARLLARFDHPSLVKVHRFWEANGSAYMVMPLYRGRTLKALRLAMGESPSEAWLRRLLEPLLGALEVLHAEDVFHRDIAPDNILVGDDGRPVLLDFGAARHVIGDQSQALTAILKPSYAPVEQYAEAQGLRQGPWTDLYALGATLAFAITGHAPQPATARALGTDARPLSATAPPAGPLSTAFLHLVDWMMALRPEHRPQSVAAVREVLDGRVRAPAPPLAAPSPSAWERTRVQGEEEEEEAQAPPQQGAASRGTRRPARALLAAVAGLAVAGAAAAAWWWLPGDPPPPVAPLDEARAATPPAVAAPTPPRATRPVVPTKRRAAEADDGATVAVAAPPRKTAAPPLRPRDQCEGRLLLALHRCLKRVCTDPALAEHRDCRRVRQVDAGATRPGDH